MYAAALRRFLLPAAFLCLAAAGAAADSLTVATFNAEFLARPKVHLKFGHKFDSCLSVTLRL